MAGAQNRPDAQQVSAIAVNQYNYHQLYGARQITHQLDISTSYFSYNNQITEITSTKFVHTCISCAKLYNFKHGPYAF